MKVKWLKFHPLSACSVGCEEEIEDKERLQSLLDEKYVCPVDAFKMPKEQKTETKTK